MNGSQVKQLAAAEVQLSRGGDNWWGEAYDYFMKFYTAIYLYKLIVAGWFFFFLSLGFACVCADNTNFPRGEPACVCVCAGEATKRRRSGHRSADAKIFSHVPKPVGGGGG